MGIPLKFQLALWLELAYLRDIHQTLCESDKGLLCELCFAKGSEPTVSSYERNEHSILVNPALVSIAPPRASRESSPRFELRIKLKKLFRSPEELESQRFEII